MRHLELQQINRGLEKLREKDPEEEEEEEAVSRGNECGGTSRGGDGDGGDEEVRWLGSMAG